MISISKKTLAKWGRGRDQEYCNNSKKIVLARLSLRQRKSSWRESGKKCFWWDRQKCRYLQQNCRNDLALELAFLHFFQKTNKTLSFWQDAEALRRIGIQNSLSEWVDFQECMKSSSSSSDQALLGLLQPPRKKQKLQLTPSQCLKKTYHELCSIRWPKSVNFRWLWSIWNYISIKLLQNSSKTAKKVFLGRKTIQFLLSFTKPSRSSVDFPIG